MIRADHYPEGTIVRVRPPHPYDTRWRIVGTVCLDGRGDHAFYGGEAPDGSKTAEVEAHWLVATGPVPAGARPLSPLAFERPEPEAFDGDPFPHITPSRRTA